MKYLVLAFMAIVAGGLASADPASANASFVTLVKKEATAGQGKPNILRTLADDLGYCEPGCYGKATSGQANYYRCGTGASGSPESPLMAVQKKPFVLKDPPPVKKSRNAPAPAATSRSLRSRSWM